MTEVIDYAKVIGDLEAKRARMIAEFDAAIRALRQIVAMEGVAKFEQTLSSLSTTTVPPSPLLRRYSTGSMVDMAIKHLASVGGGPVPNMELARALHEGGFPHRSKNFPNTLNSILHRRARTVGDVVKKGSGGWQLGRSDPTSI